MGEDIRLFVYGTLQSGLPDHARLCARWCERAEPAWTHGRLYAMPEGYPALVAGEGQVFGEVLWLRAADEAERARLWAALDEWEDHDPGRSPEENLYVREEAEAVLARTGEAVTAWRYRMEEPTARERGGVRLPDGQWRP